MNKENVYDLAKRLAEPYFDEQQIPMIGATIVDGYLYAKEKTEDFHIEVML